MRRNWFVDLSSSRGIRFILSVVWIEQLNKTNYAENYIYLMINTVFVRVSNISKTKI